MNCNEIIKNLDLTAHPEGGYYKENYRSEGLINASNLWQGAKGNRNYSTGIYFLLEKNQFSAFHKIKQDEMWHYYMGSTLLLHTIDSNEKYEIIKIGKNIEKGEILQYVVPANTWFASEVMNKNDFILCGCTVSPGFDFKDFEMPSRKELISLFPKHSEAINSLTHD